MWPFFALRNISENTVPLRLENTLPLNPKPKTHPHPHPHHAPQCQPAWKPSATCQESTWTPSPHSYTWHAGSTKTYSRGRPIPVALFFLASISSARSSFAFRQNLRKFWVFPFPIRLYRVLLTDFLHSVKIWVHLSAERRLGFGAFWLLFDASEAAGGIRQQVRRNAVKKKKKRYVFSLSSS